MTKSRMDEISVQDEVYVTEVGSDDSSEEEQEEEEEEGEEEDKENE